jgi:hypothetical protein
MPMFRNWRQRGNGARHAFDSEAVRGGTGPTDNLFALIMSLTVLIVVGGALIAYFVVAHHHGL